MLTLWVLILLNPVPGVNEHPRDIAYYRSEHQCEHVRAISKHRWPEHKYTCLPIYR
jgi:hypothetical protein